MDETAIEFYWKILAADLSAAALIPSPESSPQIVYEALNDLIQEKLYIEPRRA